VKHHHYWDATAIPSIWICTCGASRTYDPRKGRYIVTIWEGEGE
jgi:hypothetical protein